MSKNKVIYALENEHGNVKIGVTQNFESRKRTIETISGHKITKAFCTRPCSNGYFLEKQLHLLFKNNRIRGEWFRVDFRMVVYEIERLFSDKAVFEDEETPNINALCDLCGISEQQNGFVTAKSFEVADLVEEIQKVMEENKRNPYEVARQTELLLKHFGIPVIDDFVETPSPWEQMQLAGENV